MGYLNNVTGYREDLLANRAIVKHGNFALLTPDGLVKNIIPGFENCDATILSTPKLGASFVDYLVTLHQNGGNQQGFGGEGIETFPVCDLWKYHCQSRRQNICLKRRWLSLLPARLLNDVC